MAVLVTGTLIWNDKNLTIVPNSFVGNSGKGERTSEPQAIGGGAVVNIVSEDLSTKKSKFKFSLKTTTENIDIKDEMQDNFDSNVFRFVASDNKTYIYENATLINDPEENVSTDGVMDLEFESSPRSKA